MPLIDLQTNLRDLQFGRDRVAGGNSNQPYVRSTIPAPDDESGTLGYLNQDFILRGGLNAVTNSIRDVERLGRYFLDIRNPSGLLFIAKQNLLSRTAVKTQASGLLNEGIYTPLGTLAQAGGVAFGLHTNKQGLNPFGGLETYSEVVDYNQSVYENRLTDLWVNKIKNKNEDTKLLSYGGGPNSILGIGRTRINFADQRTGVNNIKLKNSGFFNRVASSLSIKEQDYLIFTNSRQTNINALTLLGSSAKKGLTYDENGFTDINGKIDSSIRQIGNFNINDSVKNDKIYAISEAPKAKKDIKIKDLNKLIAGVTNTANSAYSNLKFDSGFDINGYLDTSKRNIGSLYSINNVGFDNDYAIGSTPIAKKLFNFDETDIKIVHKVGNEKYDDFNEYINRLKLPNSTGHNYIGWDNSKTSLPRRPNADLKIVYSSYITQLFHLFYNPGTPSIIAHDSFNSSIRIGEYGFEQNFANNYFTLGTFNRNSSFKEQNDYPTLHPITNYSSFFGASTAYQKQTINENLASSTDPNPGLASPSTFTTIDKDSTGFGQGLTRTYTQKDINIINESNEGNIGNLTKRIGGGGSTTTVKDFRESIRKKLKPDEVDKLNKVGNLAKSRNYDGGRIEKKFGDPGDRATKNISNYVVGDYSSGSATPLGAASSLSYDKVTWLPLYQDIKVKDTEIKTDLIPFRIGVIDNDAPSKKTYIHFRAFLDSISDSYKAEWKGERYVGRGESFYTYGGFDRTVSLSWTVAAQSKAELMPMYKKLNFLASVCAPDYGKSGYMRGNIVTLTIGGYFFEQPGIINGFTYEMNEDKDTWEIAIGIDDNDKDDNVVQVPHIIRVKSFQFTPIHTFVPRLQQNTFDTSGKKLTDGKEHFIALEDDNTFGWKSNLL